MTRPWKRQRGPKQTKAMALVWADREPCHETIILAEIDKHFIFFAFFVVPSANKKDMRTIENIQADIQAKKKQKLMHTAMTATDADGGPGASTSKESN